MRILTSRHRSEQMHLPKFASMDLKRRAHGCPPSPWLLLSSETRTCVLGWPLRSQVQRMPRSPLSSLFRRPRPLRRDNRTTSRFGNAVPMVKKLSRMHRAASQLRQIIVIVTSCA